MTSTLVNVLVVEDDPSMREMVSRSIQSEGVAVEAASSAGEALVRLESDPLPDVVILDLRLPDADGTLVLRRIRRAGLPIRVAVLTGADPGRYVDLAKFPPDQIFRKPVDMGEVIEWLQQGPADYVV